MPDANLVFTGIGVKWAHEPEHNNMFSLDARNQIIFERNNPLASYVIVNYENLHITLKDITCCNIHLTTWKTTRNIFNVLIKSILFAEVGLDYGVKSNSIKLGRSLDNSLNIGRRLYSIETIRLNYSIHSFTGVRKTNRRFTKNAMVLDNIKEPQKIEVINIEEIKNNKKSMYIIGTKIFYSEICDIDTLKKGLSRIKGNRSLAIDGLIIADISDKRLKKLIKDLKTQKYRPKPSKRVLISTSNKDTRYLGIASAIDKVVQAALLELLTPVVESKFYDNSYGFRPNRGCHDALRNIKYKWQNVTWVINGDIERSFNNDKIRYKLLLKKLSDFMDQPAVELVGKFCKAGYIDISFLVDPTVTLEKTLQSSLISPILCNIYFHALDKFVVKKLLPKYNFEKTQAKNLKYKYSVVDKKLLEGYTKFKESIKRVKYNRALAKKLFFIDRHEPNFNRLYYVRYANNFILGYVGPKKKACVIYKTIQNFLKGKLFFTCNETKKSIVHSSVHSTYLGTLICWMPGYKKRMKYQESQVTQFMMILLNRPSLTAPIKDIFKRFILKGFGTQKDNNKKLIIATSFRQMTIQDSDVIVKKFNSIINGIMNYYSFVNRRSDLWKVCDVLRKCATRSYSNQYIRVYLPF
jgi:group II intron reverse transcriptase/maturase